MSQKVFKYQSLIVANWDKVPVVEGRVVDMGTEDIEGRKVDFLLIDTPDGHVKVFRSEGLADCFKACALGDFARIEFLATVLTANKRTFRQFRSQVWSDPDAGAFVKPAGVAGKRAPKR